MEDVIIEKEITQESKDLVINQEMQNHLMIYGNCYHSWNMHLFYIHDLVDNLRLSSYNPNILIIKQHI